MHYEKQEALAEEDKVMDTIHEKSIYFLLAFCAAFVTLPAPDLSDLATCRDVSDECREGEV